MKTEQFSKPESERVPHYFDEKDGIPKPYSQKWLDNRRKEVLAGMPPVDEEFEMNHQDAIFEQRMKEAKTLEEKDQLTKMWANEEHISAFNRENPELNIVDVLNYEAETVVKDISVGELLGKIKNMAYVPEK